MDTNQKISSNFQECAESCSKGALPVEGIRL